MFCPFGAVPAIVMRRKRLPGTPIVYVDDYIGGLASGKIARARAANKVFLDLGFMLNLGKLKLHLLYHLTGLGFALETEEIHVALPPVRQARFLAAANTVLASRQPLSIEVAVLLGLAQGIVSTGGPRT